MEGRLFLLSAFFFTVAAAVDETWYYCQESMWDPKKPYNLGQDPLKLRDPAFSPNSPAPGQDVTVSFKGTNDRNVTIDGTYAEIQVEVRAKLFGLFISDADFRFCSKGEYSLGVACPNAANADFAGQTTYPVPKEAPSGLTINIVMNFTMLTPSSGSGNVVTPVVCLQREVQIGSSSSSSSGSGIIGGLLGGWGNARLEVNAPVAESEPTVKHYGHAKPEPHGCDYSIGEAWCEVRTMCLQPFSKSCPVGAARKCTCGQSCRMQTNPFSFAILEGYCQPDGSCSTAMPQCDPALQFVIDTETQKSLRG